ncbi:MAG: hypothetical protein J7K71_00375 [Candidatus Omnitrophica bacterium]|nr:hypothetical protein [Candidatus Omnitrophota bacterium]
MIFPTKLEPWEKRIWKPKDKLKVLKEVEEGTKIVEVCRKYQIDPRNIIHNNCFLRIHSSIGYNQILNLRRSQK